MVRDGPGVSWTILEVSPEVFGGQKPPGPSGKFFSSGTVRLSPWCIRGDTGKIRSSAGTVRDSPGLHRDGPGHSGLVLDDPGLCLDGPGLCRDGPGPSVPIPGLFAGMVRLNPVRCRGSALTVRGYAGIWPPKNVKTSRITPD